ncbi:hypothetical protein BIV57_11005 [Mangrovactinospora gilvigrisea]|uniref:Uncharacterized protein n=1 Tax=Mangrovactinospora gilvigrisea TaxID=1428644 RepID=A0A1J7C7G5_9ACTN|nr:hypothetical protein [Mangrovactinospora gilvigrisea]OIV37488.1 hypothetical protein BIV57_11005 [Mangrovactinospora gilvigrisea]
MYPRRVRKLLADLGIRRRGPGSAGRITRARISPQQLSDLFVEADLSAHQVADKIGSSRGAVLRNAHELGMAVRVGGLPSASGPRDIELIEALYADPAVSRVLRRHAVGPVPVDVGRLRARFPQPLRVSDKLLADLYLESGVATTHIELLTGMTAGTVTRRPRGAGIPLRGAGGRSPFLRRLRAVDRGPQAVDSVPDR